MSTSFCAAEATNGFWESTSLPSIASCPAEPPSAVMEAPAMEELAARRSPSDIAALRALQRQAEEASTRDVRSLAEALFRYHRGVTFLSGNTITPLLFNAFTRVNLEFWEGYIRSEGVARCLERLAQFTEHIAAGDGMAAAQLLRTGLEDFMARIE